MLDRGQDGQPIRALVIDDWPRSGLPWIAFWLKELINWGTLDPVAAFLLARGDAVDRRQAEATARAYYDERSDVEDANALLDPREIRDWVENLRRPAATIERLAGFSLAAQLPRRPDAYRQSRLMVSPLEGDETMLWMDPAGYVVARSERPRSWPDPTNFLFELDVAAGLVTVERYLRHR